MTLWALCELMGRPERGGKFHGCISPKSVITNKLEKNKYKLPMLLVRFTGRLLLLSWMVGLSKARTLKELGIDTECTAGECPNQDMLDQIQVEEAIVEAEVGEELSEEAFYDDNDDDDGEVDPNFCLDASCLNHGEEQYLEERPELTTACREIDRQAREYLHSLATDPGTPLEVRGVLPRCKNHDEYCTMWAAQGRCVNDRYHDWVDDMQTDCALACQSCDQLLYENRCPLDPDAPNAWDVGDLNEFFTNITTQEKYQQWEPRVWSRPFAASDMRDTAESSQLGPWIVTLDNVFSEEECQRLIDIGTDKGYERSDDWGEYLPDGTYQTYYHEGRTSHHTWCGSDCNEDKISQGIMSRIAEITNIPEDNYETLQLLRYETSQKYETHHDYDSPDFHRQQGVRMLTVFLYLSDVEEGGGTNFPHLNLTFTPKRGRVLIWPNVLNEDPHAWDPLTEHQALPVIRGTKYAANAWVHQRNVKSAEETNCYE